MATHTFQIIVTQSGAQQTAQAISQVGASAQKSASALAFFRQALVLASTVRAAAGLVDLIDAATRIDNRLRVATSSAQEFARAQKFIFDISRQTRTEVEANAVTYGRLLQSTKALGLSSQILEQVMKGLALSVKVGGATSMEARNALIQFSQSLASGALRGDELRSVAEQLPALANAIGKEFGVSGGQLIAFAKANPGILETERVIKAVAAAVPELEAAASKMTPTIMEGFIQIQTGAIELLGTINRATGIFSVFSNALVAVGNNLNAVAIAAIAVVAVKYAATMSAWGGAATAAAGNIGALFSLIRQGNGIMASFSALFMVNPITVWVAAIGAAVTALVLLYNRVPAVKMVIDNLFTTLGQITEMFSRLYSAVANNMPSWATWENTIKVVGLAVATLLQGLVNLIALAIVPVGRAIAGIVLAMHAFGLATDETARNVVNAIGSYEQFVRNMLGGKAATESAGAATEQLTEKTKGLLSPLLGAKGGTDALKQANNELADAVKRADENSALFVAGRFINDGSWSQGSIEGFNNLARVTKDWEKYTTQAGTAVTQTATATQTAKAPTDALAGSMKGVNTQASGAAKAATTMSSAMATSAESSTTAAKQVKEMADVMAKLNPLLTAAKAAGEAAAAGFDAAGRAAQGAVGGVNALTEAFRRLAAAKASAGQGGSSASGIDGARASGGPVLKGNTYLVGEKGPELFTPNSTGAIIPNHALMSSSKTAANDNMAPLVKAINRMANAVVASNANAVQGTQKMMQEVVVQQESMAKKLARAAVPYGESSSFKGTGYTLGSTYVDQGPGAFGFGRNRYMDDPRNLSRGSYQYVTAGTNAAGEMQYALPEDYAAWMRENKVLEGDEAYRSNIQEARDSGINYFRAYQYDANKVYGNEIEDAASKLAMLKASLERYGLDAFAYSGIDIMGQIEAQQAELDNWIAKSKTATAALKEFREAGANYEQFKNAIPAMMQQKSSITDFQTYTPWQGGKDFGFNDPYGIGAQASKNIPRPSEEATAAANKAAAAPQENRIQVSMVVNTPNAESFRQNRATIEQSLASMVDRANRRAGRK